MFVCVPVENLVVVQGTWLTGLILMLLLSCLCSRKSEDVQSGKFYFERCCQWENTFKLPSDGCNM